MKPLLYVREGRLGCCRECADREGQAGRHVARESGPAQYGQPVYERIERVIVERHPQSAPGNIPDESIYDEPSTEVVREMPRLHWSAD